METQTRNLLPRVAFQRSIFGQGVLVSRSAEGLALISVVDGENSVVQDVVTSVFNGSYFLDLHFEQHDKDLFYFVKVLKPCAAAVLAYFPAFARDVRSNIRVDVLSDWVLIFVPSSPRAPTTTTCHVFSIRICFVLLFK